MKTLVMLLALALIASAAAAEMYTWKDSKGTTFYTNSLHEIPARYLKRAQVLDVATGKKGGPALAGPGTPTAPTAPAGAAASPPQAPQLVQSAPIPQAQPIAPTAGPIAAPAPAAAVAPVPAAPSRAVSAEPRQRSAVRGKRALRRHRPTLED
uniref:DUF4124 domain-containing protein n=1 Tax=Geobacter sp. (strain M21) TaxID=443144 RepID=C6DY57_GEOSM